MAINWDQAQPAPKALWTLVHANFHQTRFVGIFNKRNIAGTSTPSLHAEGRALDIGLLVARPDEKVLGDQLFQLLIDNADELGLSEVIWNKKIWSTTNTTPHTYTGVNPHIDHVHVGFTRDGSQLDNFPHTMLDLSILRTGYEDLAKANANVG